MSRLLLRLTIFTSSMYWVVSTGIFGEISTWWHMLLLIAMLGAMLIHGKHDADNVMTSRSHWQRLVWYAFAAVGIAVALPYPFNIASPVLGTALLLSLIPKRCWLAASSHSQALEAAGWLLMAQSLIWLLLEAVLARLHAIPMMQYALSAALHLLGEDAAAGGTSVTIHTESGLVTVLPTFELFHAHFFIEVLTATWFLSVVIQQRTLPIARTLGVTILYAFLRSVIVILVTLHLGITNAVWSPAILALTAWPIMWLLPMNGVKMRLESQEATSLYLARRLWPAATGIILAVAGYYWDGGTFKDSRRLLINEHNSEWEGSEDAYDTEWFGRRAGYNYYCLRQFLSHYFHVTVNHEELSSQVLADVDVLLLKTPTASYSSSELEAIDAFVRAGGGVLMLGDHTNVFGVSTYLNQICEHHGIRYNYDSQHGFPGGGLTLFRPRPGLANPVVRHVPYFMFGTGCTLDTSVFCEPIIVGYANQTKEADYSISNFFLKDPPQLNRKVGMVTQIAGVRYGRGRLLAFTDSTVFSNFWMFVPGKPELMLGMADWVCRSNSVLPLRTLAIVSAPIFIAGFFLLGAGGGLLRLVSIASLAFCVTCFAVQGLSTVCYRPLQQLDSIPEIVFCNEYGKYYLPRKSLIPSHNEEPFTSFFNAPARTDFVPREYDRIVDALSRRSRVLVLIGLKRAIPVAQIKELDKYVAGGGRLLLVVTADADTQACNEFLQQFGLAMATDAFPAKELYAVSPEDTKGERQQAFVDAGELKMYAVHGGSPLLVKNVPQQMAALVAHAHGQGQIVVLSCGGLVSDRVLGNNSSIPDARGLRAYQMVFRLFKLLYEQKDLATACQVDSFEKDGQATLTIDPILAADRLLSSPQDFGPQSAVTTGSIETGAVAETGR